MLFLRSFLPLTWGQRLRAPCCSLGIPQRLGLAGRLDHRPLPISHLQLLLRFISQSFTSEHQSLHIFNGPLVCFHDVPSWCLPDFMLRSREWYSAVDPQFSADVLNTGTTAEVATPLAAPDPTDVSREVHGKIHPTPLSSRQAANVESERTIDASAAVPSQYDPSNTQR